MNKKVLFGVIVVLLLAGGAYAMQSKSPSSPAEQFKSEMLSEAAQFAQAIESGKPTTCTLTKGDDKMEYKIKGKMMAADITSTITDSKTSTPTQTLSHMINDEKYLYIWSDDQKQGSKMSLAVPSPSVSSSGDSIDSTPKLDSVDDYDRLKNEGYTINCQAGNFSDSVFTPPSSVEFIDPSRVMRSIPSPGADGQYDMSRLKELQKQYGGITSEEDQ